jgi:RimJ/RimL family protein N-acetyltransferase
MKNMSMVLNWLLRSISRFLRGRDRIAIRAIRPDDRERLAQAFQALDYGSIYQRFFFHKRKLSDGELRHITECDGARNVVLVATIGSGEQEVIVGLGQYASRGVAAEIAFAVEEDFRGRGIATRLLRRLVRIARHQGIPHFEAYVLAENLPMLRVFRRSGLPLEESEDDGVTHLTLALGDELRQPAQLYAERYRPNCDLLLTTPERVPTNVTAELRF